MNCSKNAKVRSRGKYSFKRDLGLDVKLGYDFSIFNSGSDTSENTNYDRNDTSHLETQK